MGGKALRIIHIFGLSSQRPVSANGGYTISGSAAESWWVGAILLTLYWGVFVNIVPNKQNDRPS